MNEDRVTKSLVIRPDQDRFLQFVADYMRASVSAVLRWSIDDGRAGILARAGLTEANLPPDTRRNGIAP